MPDKINSHVQRLNRFLPFSPSHDQIYEEYQQSDDSLNLETRALSYTESAARAGANMIVLTGDAGHGKTHLCRRLLENLLGYSEDEARSLINEKCDGQTVIPHRESGTEVRGLRIFKDFSEIGFDTAADQLEKLNSERDAVTLVCANEGRLRAVLEGAAEGSFCRGLLNDFNSSFVSGLASQDGSIHVVNLNYQSVAAAGDGRSLLVEAVHQWTSGSRWRACTDCDARDACPILANQKMLSQQAEDISEVRRKKLELVFSCAERLGTVITIREMLMIVSYLLTSGLSCEDVHETLRRNRRKTGWQFHHAYYNCLFVLPPNLTPDKLQRIPVLSEIMRLDLGLRAARGVDEKVINEQAVFPEGEIDLLFPNSVDNGADHMDAANGIDEIIGNPRNHNERRKEGGLVQAVVRALRRRAFFDGISSQDDPFAQLGFNEGGKFGEIVVGELTAKRRSELKRHVIAGLHTIQGLQLGEDESELCLVDPAFGSATSHAAILADKIPAKDIQLLSLSNKWKFEPENLQWALSGSVDWLDRHIVLRVSGDDGTTMDLLTDLLAFDCIVRAGGGYVAEEFYSHDIRRITTFLGRLAETRKADSDRITIFLGGSQRSVSIDDGMIQVSGGE